MTISALSVDKSSDKANVSKTNGHEVDDGLKQYGKVEAGNQ